MNRKEEIQMAIVEINVKLLNPMVTMDEKVDLINERRGLLEEMSDSQMKVAVYQAGHCIFGIGDDLEEALNQANEILDPKLDEDDLTHGHLNRTDGEMCFADCTQKLAAAVDAVGGDLSWEWDNDRRCLCLKDEMKEEDNV